MAVDLYHPRNDRDITDIRELFIEYQQWLGVDLCFQDFDREMRNLPGKYAEPHGCMLLAGEDGNIAGGVALWPLDEGVCEMKRLYVRPPWLGQGLGRRLAVAIVEEGRKRHYRCMRLDTLPHLTAALGLYRSLGFVDTEAYYDNPLPGVCYLELDLTA